MLFVMSNVQIYKSLQAEIDSFTPRDSIISDEEAKGLPYLQAVIKEGARMWPPATGLMSKLAPPEGDTFNGVFIPGGTEIGQCAWSIFRSKKIFGEDAAIFRPERWLQAEGEKLEVMERTLGLLWGFGKYSCLGKNIAIMELNKVFFVVSDFLLTPDQIYPLGSRPFLVKQMAYSKDPKQSEAQASVHSLFSLPLLTCNSFCVPLTSLSSIPAIPGTARTTPSGCRRICLCV
jgi:hypothetical protein